MDALSQAEKQAETAATLKASLSSKVAELEHLKNELQMAEKHKHVSFYYHWWAILLLLVFCVDSVTYLISI